MRNLSPNAEKEFEEIIEKLGSSANCEDVVSKLSEKYSHKQQGVMAHELDNSEPTVTDDSFEFETDEVSGDFNFEIDPAEPPRPANADAPHSNTDHNGWIFNHVVPWRRYAARMFDLTINGTIIWTLIAIIAYQIAPYEADLFFSNVNPGIDILSTTFFGCLGSGALLGFTGTTVGKWLFGIRILGADGNTIGIKAGIFRDLSVWMKGLAFGIPIAVLVTAFLSYKELKKHETTTWDAGRYAVLHRPSGGFQYFLNVVGILLLISATALLNFL